MVSQIGSRKLMLKDNWLAILYMLTKLILHTRPIYFFLIFCFLILLKIIWWFIKLELIRIIWKLLIKFILFFHLFRAHNLEKTFCKMFIRFLISSNIWLYFNFITSVTITYDYTFKCSFLLILFIFNLICWINFEF